MQDKTAQMNSTKLIPAALVAALALVGATLFAQDDKLHLRDGSDKVGTIKDFDYKSVKLALAGAGSATTNIKADDIEAIDWAAQPKEYKEGDAAAAGGKNADAAAKFQQVIDKKTNRAPLRQEAYYQMALCYLRDNARADAVKALKAMLSEGEFPMSRYIDWAEAQIMQALINDGKGAEAVTFADGEIARLAKLGDLPNTVDRLKLSRCRAQIANNDAKSAKSDAAALAGLNGPIAGEAKVLLGEIALRSEKNASEAERQFKEALKAPLSKTARAGCYNGLGDILLEKGKAEKKADVIREALVNYLRTALQFPPAPGDPTESHEAGIYHAGECFQYIAELSAKKDEASERNRARAKELFKRLNTDYPNSQFKDDAAKRLSKLETGN